MLVSCDSFESISTHIFFLLILLTLGLASFSKLVCSPVLPTLLHISGGSGCVIRVLFSNGNHA